MTQRQRKILRVTLFSLLGIVVALVIAAIVIPRTGWFQNYARQTVIEVVKKSTGGRAEVSHFNFTWRNQNLQVTGFKIHGNEPAGAPPLFQAQQIDIGLRVLPLITGKKIELDSLTIKQPQVNVIVNPDGTTNIPHPQSVLPAGVTAKNASGPSKGPLQTVMDLAIGHFNIENGTIQFADRKIPLTAHGENLDAHISYQQSAMQYQGQISVSPLFVQYGSNPRLDVKVQAPVVIASDKIQIANATVATPDSNLKLSAAVTNLKMPQVTAQVSGKLDLLEAKRSLGLSVPLNTAPGVPHVLAIDAALNVPSEGSRITTLDLTLGQSHFQAHGMAVNVAQAQGSFQFDSSFLLPELGRILQVSYQTAGTVEFSGRASLNGISHYSVQAALNGQNLGFKRGNLQIENAALTSRISADPQKIQAEPIHLSIAGGQFNGRASLADQRNYQASGSLSGFDLRQIASLALPQRLAWDGIISGPVGARGALKGPNSGLRMASAQLNIAPGRRGIPLRGQLNASYDGPTAVLSMGQSFLALPASRIDFSGSLGKQMTVRVNSRNLNDFLPALALASSQPPAQLPVQLDQGGSAQVDATITGKMTSPAIAGHAAVRLFRVQQRHFDLLSGDLNARSDRAALRNAMLIHGPLNMQFALSVGLDRWKPKPSEPLEANLSIRNGDVQDVLALAGKSGLPIRGMLDASAQASGTLGNPQGMADLSIANGEAYGQPLTRVSAKVQYGGQTIAMPSFQIVSGASRVNLNASFQHPPNSFSTGTIRAHVDTNQVMLAAIQPLVKQRPQIGGEIQLTADAGATLGPGTGISRVHLTNINGEVAARGLSLKGGHLGDLNATARTNGNQLAFVLNSDFAGSRIRANGQTNLAANYETMASLSVQNLAIEKALAVAGKNNLGASGLLSLNGQVSGTPNKQAANLDFGVTRAKLQKQPIDRIQGHVNYSDTLVDIPNLDVQAGPDRVSASGSFQHAAGTYSHGDIRLKVNSNPLQLARIQKIEQLRPGLSGTMQLALDTALTLNGPQAAQRVVFTRLNGRISANELSIGKQTYGGFTASAEQSGSTVKIAFDSNLAQSAVHASGQVRLARDYPIDAQLSFGNIRYANWAGLLGKTNFGSPGIDALLEGKISVAGPAVRPADLTGQAQITKLEVTTAGAGLKGGAPVVALRNNGPVTMVKNQTGIHIQQARFAGPITAVNVTGDVTLKPAAALNLNVAANADLALLSQIERDVSSSGDVSLSASVKGPPASPLVDGRVQLSNAAFQKTEWPSGVSNANGVILLTGNSARIQSLNAESGGGKISVTGGVTRSGSRFTFNLQTRANNVMVLTQAGVSAVANANVKLTGTNESSLLSGNVTVLSVGFQTHTDIGSILTQTAAPMVTPSAPKGFMAGMKLDIAIRMAVGATFRSSYTENLEAQAGLTLRGTAANAGMLGRVTITQGTLVFFGTKYTINEGSVTFFNPSKIEPVLNVNLGTTVQGVNVILTVTGPVQNMNFSYHSDPPLQFSEIIGLLAAGKTPTSDPVLLANQPQTPSQSFTQMGESALVSTVIANPVAGQLQRVFGVTSLKISPSFVSGSELPQARLTLQQRISQDITFTYVTDLNTADPQIVRVEWAISPQWSAVATRDVNGLVGVDFFYKHSFR